MSILKTILASEAQIFRDEFHHLEDAEVALLERVICELKEHRRFKAIRCEIGPFYHTNEHGEKVMAQQLTVGVAYTAALVFTDADGATGVGPVGVVSASDATMSIGLSADGQSINLLMPQELTGVETVRWSDPSGVVPDATIDVTDQAETPPFTATGVAIGAFVEGSTA